MTEQQRVNRIPAGVVAGISAAVVAVGGGAAWWAINSQSPITPITPPAPDTVQPSTPPSSVQLPAKQTAQIYWLKDTANHLELVSKSTTVAAAQQPNVVLEAAFNSLLAGPTDAALVSTVPEGTKLRGLKIQNDGIHVNLSEEFTTGGGSASMTGRVAQVLYTATTLQPNAKVWIDVEGKPLEVLGGEGLELAQPLTRQSFKEDFSL